MSSAETPTPSSPPSPNVPQPVSPRQTSDVRPLKRETIVMGNDRGRMGVLVALCSLAGVVIGFGLSNMAASMRMYHCPVEHVRTVQAPMAAPVETPAWLGVRITNDYQGGAYVQHVEVGSPARSAGIQRGDVIVGFSDGSCPKRAKRVSSARDLVRMVRSADVGDRSAVVVRRNGQEQVVHARLEHMPMPLFLDEIR